MYIPIYFYYTYAKHIIRKNNPGMFFVLKL